jgi:hypothetical protein
MQNSEVRSVSSVKKRSTISRAVQSAMRCLTTDQLQKLTPGTAFSAYVDGYCNGAKMARRMKR